jgi:acylphosphatase
MGPTIVRARVVVSGRVQGVWFRQSTADRAAQLGVSGSVRNLDDGRVEAFFEGSPTAVASGLEFARRGPERARVDHIEIDYEPPTGEQGFAVR